MKVGGGPILTHFSASVRSTDGGAHRPQTVHPLSIRTRGRTSVLVQMLKKRVRRSREGVRTMLARPARITLRSVRRVINIYNRADDFCRGAGLEVGALSLPFRFTQARMRYADVTNETTMRDILDAIPIDHLYEGTLVQPDILLNPPRYDLKSVTDGAFDFVYSSHSLEHSPNPIFALSEYLRVVKPQGHVYTVIPNKDTTYDIKRRTTPAALLIDKYRKGTFSYTLEEALDVVENSVGHALYEGKDRAFAEEILRENSGIHHFHTFDPASVIALIEFCKDEFGCSLAYFCVEGINIHFCLRSG
jgi:SAM-dependent methyltransferase